MTFYVTDQNFVIICLFLLGVTLGVLYDLFSVKRILVKTPQALLVLEDLIFSLVALVSFLIAIFITNYGYVRWYEIFSFICGFSLYKILFGRFFVKALLFIIRLIIKTISFVLFPVKKLLIFLLKFAQRIKLKAGDIAYSRRIRRYSVKRMKRDGELSRSGFKI